MIHVTQGHELGIGLEVFFKAFVRLKSGHNKYILYADLDSIKLTAQNLNINFKYYDNYIEVNNHKLLIHFLKKQSYPQSTDALYCALDNIQDKKDILFTLPTSKNQLIDKDTQQLCHGYTEFLRKTFNNNYLTMSFLSPDHTVSLITDHIPLREVASTISSDLIVNKVINAIEAIKQIRVIKRIIIAAINPHAGEGGLLGNEDECIKIAIQELQKIYSQQISGPIPGDTMHFHYQDKHDLLVYMYHDQGLAPFKFINGLIGINMTCGLDFTRVSVDHGTSFELFGKNRADESGCLYLMEEISKSK